MTKMTKNALGKECHLYMHTLKLCTLDEKLPLFVL